MSVTTENPSSYDAINKVKTIKPVKDISNQGEIELLMKSITVMESTIYSKRREINELTREIEQSKKRVYTLCNHDWIKEKEDGAYGSSWFLCSTCNLYRKYGDW